MWRVKQGNDVMLLSRKYCFHKNSRYFCASGHSVIPAPVQTGSRNSSGRIMNKQPCTYIIASARNGTLYIGVTSNLVQRIWQHKNSMTKGFAQKYNVHMLVYYEQHETMEAAITREKQLKKWNRAWKIKLIEKQNRNWQDLWESIQ